MIQFGLLLFFVFGFTSPIHGADGFALPTFLHQNFFPRCEEDLERKITQSPLLLPTPAHENPDVLYEQKLWSEENLFHDLLETEMSELECQNSSLQYFLSGDSRSSSFSLPIPPVEGIGEPDVLLNVVTGDQTEHPSDFEHLTKRSLQILQMIAEHKKYLAKLNQEEASLRTITAVPFSENQLPPQAIEIRKQLHQSLSLLEESLFLPHHPLLAAFYQETTAPELFPAEPSRTEPERAIFTAKFKGALRQALIFNDEQIEIRRRQKNSQEPFDIESKKEIFANPMALEELGLMMINKNPGSSGEIKKVSRLLCAMDAQYGRGIQMEEFMTTVGLTLPFLFSPPSQMAGLSPLALELQKIFSISRIRNSSLAMLKGASLLSLNWISFRYLLKECFPNNESAEGFKPLGPGLCKNESPWTEWDQKTHCFVDAALTLSPLVFGAKLIKTKYQPLLQDLKNGDSLPSPENRKTLAHRLAENILIKNDQGLSGALREMVEAKKVLGAQFAFEETARRLNLPYLATQGGDLLPLDARLRFHELQRSFQSGRVLTDSEKRDLSQLTLGDSLSFLPFYNTSWILATREEERVLPLLYEITGTAKTVNKKSAITPFYAHPDFEEQLKDLNKIDVKIFIDPTLALQEGFGIGGIYRPNHKAIVLGPNTQWHVFLHEVQHVYFEKNIGSILTKANLQKMVQGASLRQVLSQSAFSKGIASEAEAITHSAQEITHVENMLRQGFSSKAINEFLSTHRELKALKVWDQPQRFNAQIYQKYHQIRGLQQPSIFLKPEDQQKLLAELTESLGLQVLLNYGHQAFKELLRTNFEIQPLVALTKNPVHYILQQDEDRLYFCRSDGTWEAYQTF